jgi:mono/diheme cytochrome c family protein
MNRSTLPRRTLALALALAACKATPPGRLERAVAAEVKRRFTVGGRSDPNPVAPTDDNVRRGRQAFSAYCVVCHGLDGQNAGVPFAEAMSPPVPRLTSPEVQRYTDGQLHSIIDNGIFPSGMPASRGILSDEEMWRIVLYIRHLPPAGSLGEPSMYGGTSSGSGRPARAVAIPIDDGTSVRGRRCCR